MLIHCSVSLGPAGEHLTPKEVRQAHACLFYGDLESVSLYLSLESLPFLWRDQKSAATTSFNKLS